MSQVALPFKVRWRMWLRSAVLPDLTRLVRLERVLKWYTPAQVLPELAGCSPATIWAAVDAHMRGRWRMRGRRCLRRGLLAFYLLRSAGHPAILRIGVIDPPEDRTLAHCWTTVGELIDDPPDTRCVTVLVWPLECA